MKASNVAWVLLSGGVCFAIGWMLPSPLADSMRYVSNVQEKRGSGQLEIFVDLETGCEYVGLEKGSLTPRVGPNGKQVCKQGQSAQR
ncbi:hypothetical protein HDG34_003361 [Paraburkholderia sp. HC6.4b]|uniref:DUF6440 family protein n=1 Tax=unclassified Paraburkholderia TaxID=2615204 RepID=UPI00161C6A0D|nr:MULTISPECIES: DUF6440 family protein [unclassified Paraburkholderia]MBB5409420.1 hypothetical protein [Paraburkholderia sp. HC6.4b]MBB5451150.1 hypothetical protein [Paraburkholderia sp. Kb1A]